MTVQSVSQTNQQPTYVEIIRAGPLHDPNQQPIKENKITGWQVKDAYVNTQLSRELFEKKIEELTKANKHLQRQLQISNTENAALKEKIKAKGLKKQIDKLETKQKVEDCIVKFQNLNLSFNQIKIPDNFSDIGGKESFKPSQEAISKNTNAFNSLKKDFQKIETEVESILCRLSPTKCHDKTKGPAKTQLRNEMIKLWSDAAHAHYEVELKVTHLTKKIDALAEMSVLIKRLSVQLQQANDYADTSPTIHKGLLYSQILSPAKEQFEKDLNVKEAAFNELHDTAIICEGNLKALMPKFSILPSNNDYAKFLAKGDESQAVLNLKKFSESYDEADKLERNLYEELVKNWSHIKVTHLQLRTILGQFSTALKTSDLTFPWKISVKLDSSKSLTYDPPVSY